jgi:multiple sugar transport system substrate-binding protein
VRHPRLALMAAGLVAAITAAGCGSDGGDSGDGGPVTLRFTWWGSDARHKMTQEMIDAFEAEHPDIRVEGEFTGWGDYWDKLATSVAGGNAPDIIQQESRYVREYADRKALLDLSQHGAALKTDKLDPAVAQTGTIDGRMFAVPTGVNAYTVVANPGLFEKAGVELPDDKTWTWDDYLRTASRITKSGQKDLYGLQNFGFNDAGLEIFARQRGESLFNAEGGIGVSDQTLTEWFTMVLKSRDLNSEPQPSLTIEVQAGGIDQSLMATSRGATGVWWTNEVPTLSKAAGVELALLRFPGEAAKPGMYLKPAMFLSASARTEHPEQAATFIDWMINSPKAAEIQLSDRGLPVNLDNRRAVFDELKPADQISGRFLEEITPTLQPPPVLPPMGAGEVQSVLQQLNEQLLFDRITVADAVKEYRSQTEAALR